MLLTLGLGTSSLALTMESIKKNAGEVRKRSPAITRERAAVSKMSLLWGRIVLSAPHSMSNGFPPYAQCGVWASARNSKARTVKAIPAL